MSSQPKISRFFKNVVKKPAVEESQKTSKPVEGSTTETSICLSDDDDEDLLAMYSSSKQSVNKYMEKKSEVHVKSKENIDEKDNVKPDPIEQEELSTESTDIPNDLEQLRQVSNDILLKKRFRGSTKVIREDDTGNIIPVKKKAKSSASTKLTPLDEQVRKLRLKNMDKILVIRVGYKYKCFAQDAVKVANILQIKLVEGKLTFDESNPQDVNYKQYAYCSFPDVRLNVHLERLIHHNLKVGVVEQAETTAIKKQSANKNNVFEREISSVFSKATYGVNIAKSAKYKDTNLLGDTRSIWIIHLDHIPDKDKMKYLLLSVNLNSGEIIYDEFEDMLSSMDQLLTRVKYLEPVEVIISNQERQTEEFITCLNQTFKRNDCQIQEQNYDNQTIDNSFIDTLYTNCDIIPQNIRGLIIEMNKYLLQYNTGDVLSISSNYKPFKSKLYMLLDGGAMDALDIFANSGKSGSLLWILDHTRTPFGYRMLRDWIKRPLVNVNEIEKRLEAIEAVSTEVSHIFFEALNQMLKSTPDLLHILNRITYGRGSRKEVYYFLKQINALSKHFKLHEKYVKDVIISPTGKFREKSSLLTELFEDINNYFQTNKADLFYSMINISAVLDKDSEKQIVGFFNLNNYDKPERLIAIQRDIDEVKEELNNELKRIKNFLKRPHLTFKNETEYLIEVRNTQLKNIPDDWTKVNCTKMVSRFLTPECSTLVDKLQYHKELLIEEAELEYKRFLSLLKAEYVPIRNIIQRLAEYDCILSLAATSCNSNYVRPTFHNNKGQFVNIKNGRNAVIESLDVDYVPNDVKMSSDNGRINIITGPNMGGKSSYIRQVALLIIMAQIGSYVPADSMECSVFDNVLTRIGAYDDLINGQSTFKVEMSEVLHIINNSTSKSLLLLDEVGRGTGTTDGKAISYAILKYFMEMKDCPIILFTTHFSMLAEQLRAKDEKILQNYYMDYMEQQNDGENWQSVIFLYKLKKGSSKDSYGLNVAKLASIENTIINHAYDISSEMKLEEEKQSKTLDFLLELKSILKNEESTSEKKLGELLELSSEIQDS